MTKVEILSRLEELKGLDFTTELNQEFSELTQKYYALSNEEEKGADSEEEDNLEEKVVSETEKQEQEQFKVLAENFKAKRAEFFKARDGEEAKNLGLKKFVLKSIRELIQSEENIGKAFGSMNELRDQWNAIGNVSKKVHHEIQQEYSALTEEFYYNINIYKALQENDLRRNLQRKQEIIESLKNLEAEENIKLLETELRFLQNEWENIGPTRQEDWEAVKTAFWDIVKSLYGKIRDFYENRRGESIKNIERKAALIEQLKSVLEKVPESYKHWEIQTEKVVNIQKEWKNVGFGPKEENEKLWKEFRSICDSFFNAKREFYKERNQEFAGIKEAKEAIINQVKGMKTSEDWKESSEKIKQLQNKWRTLGNAGPRWEQKLWKIFRSHCDEFFNARQKHFEAQDKENEANLALKEALIVKLKALKPKGSPKEIIHQLKEFSNEFNNLGNVPFKQKDQIYKDYKSAMDAQYEALDMDHKEKQQLIFDSRVETMVNSENSEELLYNERERIRKQITKLSEETIQLENNLGFFGRSSAKSPMVIEVKNKIEKAKKEIEKLKATLKKIPKS